MHDALPEARLANAGAAAAAWPSSGASQRSQLLSTPLDQASYSVLDVETTGGSPPDHRVTEIAVFRVEGRSIREEFSTLVNPQRSVPHFVSSLTGITGSMLQGKPTMRKIAAELTDFIGDSVIVAHHSEFDRRFINHELRLARRHPLKNPDLCTCKLARRILPWLPSKSLGALADYFGIHCEARHRASADALVSAKLLLTFTAYLMHRGVLTVADALRFQEGGTDYPQ